MTQQERPVRDLQWITDGTRRLLAGLGALDDAALDQPSLRPAGTAGTCSRTSRTTPRTVNLLSWARTGQERRMYVSDEQRAADIAAGGLARRGAAFAGCLVGQVLWADLDWMP